jgi:hypothetical protein
MAVVHHDHVVSPLGRYQRVVKLGEGEDTARDLGRGK